jgi:hypothetical protein
MENNLIFKMMLQLETRNSKLYAFCRKINQVWDITDLYNVSKIENTNQSTLFKANLGELRKYVAIDASDYTPLKRTDLKSLTKT